MTREETIDVIEKVLERYGELQVNLASPGARAEIAAALFREIEESVPGQMSLSELVSLPPRPKSRTTWTG